EAAGEYWLRIRHCSDTDTKSQKIKVNDETPVVSKLPYTGYGVWGDYQYGKINLNAGANKISIIAYSTWVYFDYIDVTPYQQYTLTVTEGSGSGDYDLGAKIEIVANDPPSGQIFDKWVGDIEYLEFPEATTTMVNMPSNAVTVEATFRTPSYFDLTVIGGSGSGNHAEGDVAIVADPAPAGQVFDKWIGETKGIGNFTIESTIYEITDMDATITATYRNEDNNTNMALGTNFWFIASWSGEEPMLADSNIDWATAYENGDDIWNPVWIEELSIYKTLRFMDWAATNNSNFRYWKDRRLPTDPDNHYAKDVIGADKSKPGLAYEWIIDACNKANTDLWINVPHKAKKEFWDGLSVLIAENLNEGLKCYIEYSNETWNPGFTQNGWIINQGQGLKMPGSDKYYKGGSYHVYISYQIFDSFETSFEDAGRAKDLVKVLATGGNIDFVVKAIRDNDPKVNPLGQKADAFSIAPYIGGGSGNLADDIDGQDPLVLQKQNEWLKNQISPTGGNPGATIGRVIQARQLADEFDMLLIAYEGGTHNLVHAADWSRNPLIYDHYTNMLSVYEDNFDLFCHYTHTGGWFNSDGQGAWGSREKTGDDIADAHKYRALRDWSMKHALDPDSPILELEQGAALDLKVYPNPVKDGSLTIESAMNKSSVVVVTNIMGQEIMRTDFKENKLTISTTGFQKGLYFISIVNNNNISTQKFIVE
ncbi:MAG: T9SS type A sorting domain-containing protein, partial [Flavobacteriales bacterium]|nr:T9SS type A sorting domain-containing protein [Flavobacteriales bacterium]